MTLTLTDVRKSFAGTHVLGPISVGFCETGVTAIAGPNGSGKTTLLDVISGFVHADRGTVTIRGRDTTSWEPVRIAKLGVARTFQSVRVSSSRTVTDNLRVSCHGSVRSFSDLLWRARDAERHAALVADELLRRFRLDNVGDVIAGELSFGMQKLLASACVLATQAPLLLLDEPFAGLSPSLRELLADELRHAAGGATVIIVEHDLFTIENVASRLLVLARGQIVADGNMSAVLGSAEAREALIG